jgi:hypothetical protein
VFTTQIGLVRKTVAVPAMAPAAMDSTVESWFFLLVRWKKARENSYPFGRGQLVTWVMVFFDRCHTVVVDEVCYCDAEQGTLHSCVEPLNTFAIDDALGGCESACSSLLPLNLRSGRERDEWVSTRLVSAHWISAHLCRLHQRQGH